MLHLCDTPQPEKLRRTLIAVIPKSSDLTHPANYPPSCTTPMLCKLCGASRQTSDSARFRPGHSARDHLHACFNVCDSALANGSDSLSKKALDSFEHNSIWHALRAQDMDLGYITLPWPNGQSTHLQGGTTEGDPLSSLLFKSCHH